MKIVRFISKYEDWIYAALRIITGFLFLWHGSQKLFGYPSGAKMPDHVIFIAGPIEFFGGLLIMSGFLTRIAAFLASGEMAYAYWTVHAPGALLPIINHGELAIVYCFLFLYFFVKGSGRFSLDQLLSKRRKG